MFRHRTHRRSAPLAALLAILAMTGSAGGALAHKHVVNEGTERERVIANGQNHPQFIRDPATGLFMSCTKEGHTIPSNFGPAWYGLETAHHGPDSGTPGKGDLCYGADASPLSEDDDVNPAID